MARRTVVGTSVARVIEDDQLPNSVKTGVLRALFEGGEIVEYIQEGLVSSIATRAEQMYQYAGRGTYVFGLPSGEFKSGETGTEEVLTVLEAIEPAAVTLSYTHFGPPNHLHIGWIKLISSHGYNPATNQLGTLTASLGTPVYLDNMVVVVPSAIAATVEPGCLEQWGIAAKAGYTPERTSGTPATRALIKPSPVQTAVSGVEHLLVSYIYRLAGVLTRATFTVSISGYDIDANYFHARYVTAGVTKYWMYKDNTGTYPALDAVFNNSVLPDGSFFPFAYFRYNGISEIDDTGSPEYLTSKKLVKYLGMDYDAVSAAIDSSPEIADVKQAMMMMAVPANTTNQLELRYLFDFFDNVYDSPEFSGAQYGSLTQAQIAAGISTSMPLKPAILIQDTRFKMSVELGQLFKKRVGGSIGAVGTHTTSTSTIYIETPGVDQLTTFAITISTPVLCHFYRRQVSTGIYEEIQVQGLKTIYWILGDYRQSMGEGDDPILLIPLDKSITSSYSAPDREVLYSRSLHYVFNSVLVINVAWYQSSIFKFIVTFVAAFIFISSMGSGFELVALLLDIGAYSAVAMIFLGTLLKTLLVTLAFKLFVKAVGTKVAFIVAILAIAAAAYGEFSGVEGLAGAPWAEQLLSISSGLTQTINTSIQNDMSGLANEAREFDAYKEEQLNLLESAQDLLENRTMLSPLVIFGESPDDYYNRTVHSGNIGVIAIEGISNYAELMLRLPSFNDSIGEDNVA